MPGIVYHLYFGKKTMEELCQKDIQLDNDYLLGNILPDFAKNKDSAHHYPDSSSIFFVPNLEAAMHRYSRVTNSSLHYGILAHLYLDKCLIEKFLTPRFKYDPRSEIVLRPDTGHRWTLQKFFSDDGLYRAYSEINPLMFKNNLLNLDWLSENIPHQLPKTRLSTLDDHIADDWFETLTQYLTDPPEYTGDLFTYDELVEFIDQTIDDFVNQDYLTLFGIHQNQQSPQPEVNPKSEEDRFRQGVTDILTKNPSSEHRQLVLNTVNKICKEYQEYFTKHWSDYSHYKHTDTINDIALTGARELHSKDDLLRLHALDAIYRHGLVDELLHKKLNDTSYRVCVDNLLMGLAAVDGEFYRLIVSYSTF